MSINLKIPDIRELKPRITVFGVGGAGGNAVNNMINAGLQGVDFVVANTRCASADHVAGRTHHSDGRAGNRGARCRIATRCGMYGRRGGDRRDPRSPERRTYGLRHRRHGRRHRDRRFARGRQGGARTRHPDGRRRHQAVPLRRPAAHAACRSRHRRAAEERRHAASSSRTRTCSGSPTRRRPSPTPSRWPTRCSIRASPASPT